MASSLFFTDKGITIAVEHLSRERASACRDKLNRSHHAFAYGRRMSKCPACDGTGNDSGACFPCAGTGVAAHAEHWDRPTPRLRW